MKNKIKIEKIDGKIAVTNGVTMAWGFKNWSEARKFLLNFKIEKLCQNLAKK